MALTWKTCLTALLIVTCNLVTQRNSYAWPDPPAAEVAASGFLGTCALSIRGRARIFNASRNSYQAYINVGPEYAGGFYIDTLARVNTQASINTGHTHTVTASGLAFFCGLTSVSNVVQVFDNISSYGALTTVSLSFRAVLPVGVAAFAAAGNVPGDGRTYDFVYSIISTDANSAPVLTATVTPVVTNTAPTITSAAAASVQENQTAAIDVNATDTEDDAVPTPLTYSLTPAVAGASVDNGLFAIDANTGVVTFNAAPDFETPGSNSGDNNYQIQVQVEDSGGLTTTQDITVTVTDVNEDTTAPTVTISGVPTITDGVTTFGATFTFDEDVTGFDAASDITTNGSATAPTGGPRIYTSTITPNASADTTVQVAANVAQDAATNANTASATSTASLATLDATAPTVTITTSSASHDGSTAFTATVTFNEPVNGFLPSEITATNATLGGAFTTGADGDAVYTIEVTPTGPQDVVLSIAAAVAKDAAGNDNLAAADVTVTGTVVQITKERITSFLTNRANHILNNQPNLTGFITGQSNTGGGPLGYLAINGNEGSQNVRFATSRSKVLAARDGGSSAGASLISPTAQERIDAAFGQPEATEAYGIDGPLLGFAPAEDGKAIAAAADDDTTLGFGEADGVSPSRAGTWDIWTEIYGSRSYVETSTSSLWVGFVGMHYFVDDRNVIGLIGQLDWSEETNSAVNSSADGTGWMIGPYIAGQFKDQNLFYEASIRYGQSDNTISPIGTYTDSFDTTRWMASGKLSGTYKHDDITIRPEASVTWYEETQEAYTDSLSNAIPESTVSLGELRFGPTFSRTMILDDGTQFAPTLGINGVYNFDLSDNNASQGATAGTEELRARISAGFAATNPDNGITLTTEFFYDGLFINDYETYGGRARVTVPLN